MTSGRSFTASICFAVCLITAAIMQSCAALPKTTYQQPEGWSTTTSIPGWLYELDPDIDMFRMADIVMSDGNSLIAVETKMMATKTILEISMDDSEWHRMFDQLSDDRRKDMTRLLHATGMEITRYSETTSRPIGMIGTPSIGTLEVDATSAKHSINMIYRAEFLLAMENQPLSRHVAICLLSRPEYLETALPAFCAVINSIR